MLRAPLRYRCSLLFTQARKVLPSGKPTAAIDNLQFGRQARSRGAHQKNGVNVNMGVKKVKAAVPARAVPSVMPA